MTDIKLQGILCYEPTADNSNYFLVDSEETFNRIKECEKTVLDEANHWGSMTFDDIDVFDEEDIDIEGFYNAIVEQKRPVITAEDVSAFLDSITPLFEHDMENAKNEYMQFVDGYVFFDTNFLIDY